MLNNLVVSPDLMLDWLEKRKNIFVELDNQLIRGLQSPGTGLTLDQLQAAVEHRNPFVVVEAVPKPKSQPKPLIKWSGTIAIPATTERFVVKDHIVVNTSDEAEVKIVGWGDNFGKLVLPISQKPMAATTLRYGTLQRYAYDTEVVEACGGQEKAVTTPAEMFACIRRQGRGQSGPLFTDGRANIFEILDDSGSPCVVLARWVGRGWHFLAFPVPRRRRWHGGGQVFSRNS